MLNKKENAPNIQKGAMLNAYKNNVVNLIEKKRLIVEITLPSGHTKTFKRAYAWTLLCLSRYEHGLSRAEARTQFGISRIDNDVCALRKLLGFSTIRTDLIPYGNSAYIPKWFCRYRLGNSIKIKILGGFVR